MAEKLKLKLNPDRTLADSIRTVAFDEVVEAVRLCCLAAATKLPEDVLQSLQDALKKESNVLARELIEQCLENARIAREENMPICQDTGFAVYFVEMGTMVRLDRGTIYDREFLGYALSFKDEVKVQIKEFVSGGNDSRHIQISRDGCHAIVLSAPTRYLHSSSCVLDINDTEEMETLVYKMLCNFQCGERIQNA